MGLPVPVPLDLSTLDSLTASTLGADWMPVFMNSDIRIKGCEDGYALVIAICLVVRRSAVLDGEEGDLCHDAHQP